MGYRDGKGHWYIGKQRYYIKDTRILPPRSSDWIKSANSLDLATAEVFFLRRGIL